MTEDSGRKIAVVHSDIPADAPLDEKDVLVEAGNVSEALRCLGFEPVRMPFVPDLSGVVKSLTATNPLLVFNLVETLLGKGSLIHYPLLVFDYLKLPYTGSGGDAMYLTSNKVMAKTVFAAHGIPTPKWQTLDAAIREGPALEPPFIMKPIYEDASVDITDDSVFYAADDFMKEISRRNERELREYFIEQFIEGREINLSLLAMEGEPRVLPPAEILFAGYPAGKPQIVGYSAKWEERSFEFSHTPRTFDFSEEDMPMLGSIEERALQCWQVSGLRGYARVDFRVDRSGKPWVLEVNANPCISPDSGFVAAACRAGIRPYEKIIHHIVADALAGIEANEHAEDYLSAEYCTG